VLIDVDDWQPTGVDDLEPAAWTALRHPASAVVVAGPGAGKTEFLAQRACYLLQTGLCPAPRRILAISFKTDAAKNLRTRVHERVGSVGAHRFDSMTFDAFTKQLLDRFVRALPVPFRLQTGYELSFVSRREIDSFLSSLGTPPDWAADVAEIARSTFEPVVVGSYRLPVTGIDVVDGGTFALHAWWKTAIPEAGSARLTFTHVNRLVELIVRSTPQICRALQATYPFVFIDECQDTTVAQFDLVSSLFARTPAVVTAVGDAKQRIMGWAGAMQDAIGAFSLEFGAQGFELIVNHRSVPELVKLQSVVARSLESTDRHGSAQTKLDPGTGVAEAWLFPSVRAEAATVAHRIAGLIASDAHLGPEDFALLVRQTPDVFEPTLSEEFELRGLSVRNESEKIGRMTLQDLLLEELTLLVIGILRLSTVRRDAAAWSATGSFLRSVWGVDPYDDAAPRAVDEKLAAFLMETSGWLASTEVSGQSVGALLDHILAFVGPSRLRAAVPSYRTGDTFERAVEAVRLRLESSAVSAGEWIGVADGFLGAGSVPMMTVHKSKGLEYQHVIFLGIDDKLWWAHSPGELEGISAFFVGLSRARLTARFTFCEQRGARTRVADLYALLTEAGVPEVVFDGA